MVLASGGLFPGKEQLASWWSCPASCSSSLTHLNEDRHAVQEFLRFSFNNSCGFMLQCIKLGKGPYYLEFFTVPSPVVPFPQYPEENTVPKSYTHPAYWCQIAEPAGFSSTCIPFETRALEGKLLNCSVAGTYCLGKRHGLFLGIFNCKLCFKSSA